ncbi:tetratricopeptide repeat protein [Candidatus Odyssella acanthamoebae]|uniref:SEL1-like repeat protein n=1 Tax=Candidatus Odyssella acanthamoebae TaxID=91604 RepID=UPI0018DBF79A|nr:tetratricopeptide repeat protein [Candidatus Paracaedibacter acanthamoebae]
MEYTVPNFTDVDDPTSHESNSQKNNLPLKAPNNTVASENIYGNLLYNRGLSHYKLTTKSQQQKYQDLRIARSLFTEAAEQNHSEAAKLLGKMWENGEGGDQDYEKAEKFYLKAKNLGDLKVAYQLEVLYKKTNQVDKRFNLYRELAEAGESSAQVALGNMYMEGVKDDKNEIAPNMKLAIEWYDKAARQGDIKGQYLLGRAYFKIKHYDEAAKYFEKINNNPQARKILGDQLFGEIKNGLGNIYARKRERARDAVKLYKESLALGNRNAQEMLDAVSNKLPKARKDENGQEYPPLL